MVIERSKLLEQSFNHIIKAEAETLQAGLRLEFKNEGAVGNGVKREWLSLVCKALFDPQNEFFEACPNDRIRFFPNSASGNHKYFEFAGRVIALALMHKVHIGVVLDRVIFLQMAEKNVSLEDIRDVDPTSYSSYKKMLEMDAESVDKDNLALTFHIDENGKSVELVPGGTQIAVNSRNRRLYVDLRIQHYYVKSLAPHVAHFKKGFDDIISCPIKRRLFFQLVELGDFDMMLRGSAKPISTEDWMTRTVYNGYLDTDSEIEWFWMVVGEMSEEQKKDLLFFWTSVECLPAEGFLGLPTLNIYKGDTWHGFPISNTCFYRLTLPPCTTLEVMRYRLNIITQKDISRRFGFE